MSESKGDYYEIETESVNSRAQTRKTKMSTLGKIRNFFDREFAAEFLSTFILILLGDGSVAQYQLLNSDRKSPEPFLSVNFGYGCAVMFGCYIAGGISGAHMNPAVSIALAVVKKFKWSKVPKYILAQMFGAFVGALAVFITYVDRLMTAGKLVDPLDYRGIFATYPDGGTTTGGQLLDQVMGTFILLLLVSALIDHNNSAPPQGMGPILIGGSVFAIGLSFGTNCGYAINPARDLGPRVASALLGYKKTFSSYSYYFWIPVIGPIIGAVIGAVTYLLMIEKPKLSCFGACKNAKEKEEARDEGEVVSNGASAEEINIEMQDK